MAYPVCVFVRKSDGSYFQVRDSDLALINEWKWSATRYVVHDFAIDTLGNIFFAKGDTYIRKHAEDGTVIKVVTAPAVRYTYDIVFNLNGYVTNLQINSDGNYHSVHGYTKDNNLTHASTPSYVRLTYQVTYGGIVADDEVANVIYVSRVSNIEKWATGVGGSKQDTIDITPYTPINLSMIDGYIVFGTTTKLYKVSKAGGSVTELPILYDVVTGTPDPVEDGLAFNGIHVGRLNATTFVVAFYATPSGTGNPYKWFVRKYNLAGTQIGTTIDLGDQGSNSVSLGSYFAVGEVSPSVVTSEVTGILGDPSPSATFNANLTNGTGKCVMRGFQYYDMATPATIWNITYSAAYYENGNYSHTTSNYLTAGHTYMVRAKAQNTIELVYGAWVEFIIPEVTTQAATQIGYDCAMGNGTITSGTNATKRGFEIQIEFKGTLGDYILHHVAGFLGDVTYFGISGCWQGTLIKTESETGNFTAGAYELVLGYPSMSGNPSSAFHDKLFKCESYTYRARATIGGVVYYGEWVAFNTLCDAGGEQQPTDDISEGDPTVPIIPYPPFEWEYPPEIPYPPWDWSLPPWEMPDYPPMSFVGDFYYKKPYTQKDLDELRKKCIIYNKNSVEFALVLRHNMNVLKEFFNMMTDYMDKDEFNDFTDIIPPQRLKELYLDNLEVNDFKDMINGFIRNTVDNNIAVNRNFSLIQEGLSDYETESDDAYFKEIISNMKTVTEDNPDVDRLKSVIDNLNQEVALNFNEIMRNLKIVRARLL